jgi:pilus assembly protein CpaB
MSFRTLLVILLALGCGVSSALGLNLVLAKNSGNAATATFETTQVVVAKTEIARGRLLSGELVGIKAWPKHLVPPGALVKVEDAIDRASLQTMMTGELVFDAKLAARGAVGGMASIIPTGKRAYTIQTKTSASKVAGFVLPGNLVDVLLTFRSMSTDETGGGSTTTLLQAVEVLAVGKQIEPVGKTEVVDAQEIESVTLLVTPEQVAKLDLGQSLGMLSLSLRNPNDHDEAKTNPATIADIRFGQTKPVDPQKFAKMFGSIVSVVRDALPRSSVAVARGEKEPEAKREAVSTSILTLRGQTWGAVKVAVPDRDPRAEER